MFVFPAFNNNYKTRKRTFRCCKTCRVKRIRCTISDATYEENGCDNCKNNGTMCDLIKGSIRKSFNSKPKKTPGRTASKTETGVIHTSASTSDYFSSSSSSDIQEHDQSLTSMEEPSNLPSDINLKISETKSLKLLPAPNNYLLPPNAAILDLPRPDTYKGSPSNFGSISRPDSLSCGFFKSPKKTKVAENLHPLPGLSAVIPRTLSSLYIHPSADSLFSSASPATRSTAPQVNNLASGNSMSSEPSIYKQSPPCPTKNSFGGTSSEYAKGSETSNKIVNEDATRRNAPQISEINQAYISLIESIDHIITKVDHRFLKEKFNFNSTFRQSQFYFTKALVHNHGDTEDENAQPRLSKKQLTRSKYLDKSNLLHFKFLLSLHAFTLDTPGFCHISCENLVKLFEIYFYKVNSIFPIVFEAEFWELHKRGRIPNIIMYAIILNAANDELSEAILTDCFVDETVSFEENFARFVKELEMKVRQLMEFLPEIGDTEKLSRLITSLLLSINFRYNKIGNEQSSSDVGDSISYAYSLLIHNEYFHDMIVKVGALQKSVYLKNLWWVIFVFDRFNALLNGKAMFIKRVDFNVPRPRELPHLDRLVLLAYSLEDTLVAAFRPQRGPNNENRNLSEFVEGDPCFDPAQIINEEISLLENPENIEKVLSVHGQFEVDTENHLPKLDVKIYRDRFVFFIERLLRHQMILVLRTGQLKVLRETSSLDTLGLKLSKSLLKIFQKLKCGQGHKLVMATPLVPSMLLVALSVPSFARYSLLSSSGDTAGIKGQLVELIQEFVDELGQFSKRWWFLHEVLVSLSKKQLADSKKSTESISPDLEYFTPKLHSMSINTLVNDATDAECVLPSSLSITSPGFYDDTEVKGDSDSEEEEQMDLQEGKDFKPGSSSKETYFGTESAESSSLESGSRRKSVTDFSSVDTDFYGSGGESKGVSSLADDLNFDVTQLAEIINLGPNSMPHDMNYFPELHDNFFF